MSDDERRPAGDPAVGSGRDETFLRRWSRRKHEARQDPAAPDAPPPVQTSPSVEAETGKARVLTDADMPPIESLDERSDFSLFMSPGVSEALRREALNKLFLLPEINRRCPLDGEWFDAAGAEPLGAIVTHEMREEMERAARKLKESAQQALNQAGSPKPDDPGASARGPSGDLPGQGRARPAPGPAAPAPQDEVTRKDPT